MTVVYKQVLKRLQRLTEVRTLIRRSSRDDDHLLQESPDYFSELFQIAHPEKPFRLDTVPYTPQLHSEIVQARTWLLQTVALQARHLPKANLIRIFRFALEKPESEWTDIDRLYMNLTDWELEDAEECLDYTFALVLHNQYAQKYAHVLTKLRERENHRIRLEKKREPLPQFPNHEAICQRILSKIHSVKVDNFASAIPVSSIINAPSDDERACPVCRNEYLDFATFEIEDLVADYPFKIKYCGHVIGKACLETWMDTPLADPAKYPWHTCPLCRTEIEGMEIRNPPAFIQDHVLDDPIALSLADDLRLEDEECWDGIYRLISEEIVIEGLMDELQGRMSVEGDDGDRLRKALTALRRRVEELQEEKTVWGFATKKAGWLKAKKEWTNMTFT